MTDYPPPYDPESEIEWGRAVHIWSVRTFGPLEHHAPEAYYKRIARLEHALDELDNTPGFTHADRVELAGHLRARKNRAGELAHHVTRIHELEHKRDARAAAESRVLGIHMELSFYHQYMSPTTRAAVDALFNQRRATA